MPDNQTIKQIEQRDTLFLATIIVSIRNKFTVWEMVKNLFFTVLQTE